ncbi:MAG: glycosyltransferase family 39 protein [Candidatus Rokubacteria bacterium]|nr:glycosyltransferase family 39 protein [Candidatus Rokubacteria bacterium]
MVTAAAGRLLHGQRLAHGVLTASTALATLCAWLTLLAFRGLDDNRLTSWQWAFADAPVAGLAGILAAAMALTWALCRAAPPERHAVPLLGLAAFLAAALFWREPEVIVDAARYFTQAKHLAVHGVGAFLSDWGRAMPVWTDLPLVPFLYGLLFAVWGEGRAPAQAFTALCLSGTVLLTYGIGRRLWDGSVGLHGGALLLGMPYLLTQVPLMLVDVPTMFFLTLAVWAAIAAIQDGGSVRLALASAALALALLSKYTAWLLSSVVPVIALVHPRGRSRGALGRAAAIVTASGLVVGALAVARLEVASAQLGLLWSYQLPGLGRWRESLASTFLFQIHPFVTVAAAWGAALAVHRRDWRFAILAWPPLLLLALGAGRSRYIIPALPMLALMAACGLRSIARPEIRRFAAACIVVASLLVAVLGYLPYLTRTSAVNLMAAGAYLDALDADVVEVLVLPQPGSGVNPAVSVPLLDLHTAKRLVARVEPPASAQPEEIERSPLRFTWAYVLPAYYAPGAASPSGPGTRVLILARPDQPLTAGVEDALRGYRLERAFEVREPWFRYGTVLRVYRQAEVAAAGGRS